jgi:hypothetical protein
MDKIFNSLLNKINLSGKEVKISYSNVFIKENVLYLCVKYDRSNLSEINISDRILNHITSLEILKLKNYLSLKYKNTFFKNDC